MLSIAMMRAPTTIASQGEISCIYVLLQSFTGDDVYFARAICAPLRASAGGPCAELGRNALQRAGVRHGPDFSLWHLWQAPSNLIEFGKRTIVGLVAQ